MRWVVLWSVAFWIFLIWLGFLAYEGHFRQRVLGQNLSGAPADLRLESRDVMVLRDPGPCGQEVDGLRAKFSPPTTWLDPPGLYVERQTHLLIRNSYFDCSGRYIAMMGYADGSFGVCASRWWRPWVGRLTGQVPQPRQLPATCPADRWKFEGSKVER